MKTRGKSREILFRLGALAALPLLVASCGGGGGGGAKTVIVQKCDKDIECTLKYEPEVSGTKKLMFELSIPTGALEESAEISIEKSDSDDNGLSFMETYKVLPETLKFIAGKRAGLILGYVYDKGDDEEAVRLTELGLEEEGLRIGKRNLEGGFDLVKDSGPPRLDVDQISGEVTGPGEYAVVYNPIIFSVTPEVGKSSNKGTTDGTPITVTGINFKTDFESVVVNFNKVPVLEGIIFPDNTGNREFTLTLPELPSGKKEEDLKGALTITVVSHLSKKNRTSNAVNWGFGSGFDAAVYDVSGSWGKLAIPGKECTDATCLTQPWGIAIDQFDCIYVADSANHRIKKFTSVGQPVSKETSCVAFDPKGDSPTHQVGSKGDPQVDKDGKSTEAGKEPVFNTPLGVTVDVKGNIYVADSLNHRIVMLNKLGKVVALFGKYGTGTAKDNTATADELNQPSGVAVDPDGNLYVVDTLNNRVVYLKVSTVTTKDEAGNETTTTTGAQDTKRQIGPTLPDAVGESKVVNFMGEPSAVAYDSASTPNRMFFADPGNYRVVSYKRNADKKLDEFDKAVGKPLETNEEKDEYFLKPIGVTVDVRSSVYIVDRLAPRIQKFDRNVRALPSTVGNPKDKTQLAEPTTIVVDSKANLYVLDRTLSKVQKFAPR